ncbi:unnamed protein product [Dibothriocephalus latus]|uniref:Galactosyltransferase N-terminal domain-containing protein n=1 Tax=Dibothriocephalus latus TaxID=60516 RepID=A0A3P6TIT3_DIBLA|nr:unnamed protein product [Dibothriocephalus latus]
MTFVPFEQLAAKYGMPSEQGTWAGKFKSTDIQYTLEHLGGEGKHSAQAVWTPVGCYQREVTAIVIPYRNRFYDLSVFINHLTPILRHQRRRYTIFLIEQVKPETFNRAALFNIGYKEALKTASYSCFIFHDVDLLPEDDRMIYGCEDHPLHMTALVDKFGYQMFYEDIFGGGVAMTRTQFQKALGYPNTYFGWGAEDDDMSARLNFSKQKLMRRNFTFSRYKMIMHKRDTGNEENPKKYGTSSIILCFTKITLHIAEDMIKVDM